MNTVVQFWLWLGEICDLDCHDFLFLATLSSNICSLHCTTEKLTFSVVWKLNKNAEILETKFYKGMINSKASLTYGEAQARLNSSKATDDISVSLKNLSFLAQILRTRRFENGQVLQFYKKHSRKYNSIYTIP